MLLRRTNHYCHSVIPSNTNSGFSPWHYFVCVSVEVRRVEDSMPKKPWKESFLALFYEEFSEKISFSRAFLGALNSLISKRFWNKPSEKAFRTLQSPVIPLVAAFATLRLFYQPQIPVLKTVAIIIFWLTRCNLMCLRKFHPWNWERNRLQNPWTKRSLCRWIFTFRCPTKYHRSLGAIFLSPE